MSFIPPPPPAPLASPVAGEGEGEGDTSPSPTPEEREAAKAKVAQLLVTHKIETEKALESNKKKKTTLQSEMDEIDIKLIESKKQRMEENVQIDAAVEEAQNELEDCEGLVEELAVEHLASRDRLVFWINSFVFLIFPGLVVKIFRLFDCTDILGTKYLTADLSVTCYAGEHLYYSIFGYFCIAAYVLGIPITTWYMLWSHRTSLFDSEHPQFFSTRRRYVWFFVSFF